MLKDFYFPLILIGIVVSVSVSGLLYLFPIDHYDLTGMIFSVLVLICFILIAILVKIEQEFE